MLIALAWQGMSYYELHELNLCINLHVSHGRLGEACSHIAAVLSCLVRAAEAQLKTGQTSCTSQKCSWLPTTKSVSTVTGIIVASLYTCTNMIQFL